MSNPAGAAVSSTAGDVPGDPTPVSTSLIEAATGALQSFAPISRIHQHLCAFHLYADDMTRQVQAHHFCSHVNKDVRQCLIFDSPDPGARLIGVEYIIAEPIFLTLSDEEKPLWHSHEYEVKSGLLFLPGVPGIVQRQDLENVAKTYGKTFHFWQVDRGDKLPLGLPSLMMAVTRDGQLHEDLAGDMSSGQSSTIGGKFQNNHIYCRCNLRCTIYTSYQVESNGRRFYRCPRNRTIEDCDFFMWIDGVEPSLSEIMNQIRALEEIYRNNFRAISLQLKFLAGLLIVVVMYFILF